MYDKKNGKKYVVPHFRFFLIGFLFGLLHPRQPAESNIATQWTRSKTGSTALFWLAWYVKYDCTLFQSKELGIIHGAGLAMGLLSNGGPMPWHPAPDNLKKVCAAAGQYCKVRISPPH